METSRAEISTPVGARADMLVMLASLAGAGLSLLSPVAVVIVVASAVAAIVRLRVDGRSSTKWALWVAIAVAVVSIGILVLGTIAMSTGTVEI